MRTHDPDHVRYEPPAIARREHLAGLLRPLQSEPAPDA